jgi:NADH:ubiquinone oxidoreductase subunit F (NADH-binding)
MAAIARVLDPSPVADCAAYIEGGGGRALDAARSLAPAEVIGLIGEAGIRGRGGAGFPTAVKWRTVAANASPVLPATVVINAAEGEPGSFKDREILRRNPFRVLEGALVAAHAVGADRVIVGVKRSATTTYERVERAIDDCRRAGWLRDIAVVVHGGPSEYLLGEETALLESIDGRPPFPRIAPPYRRGVDEVVEHADDAASGSGLSAHVEMAGPGGDSLAPPTVVDNVETLAHVTVAMAEGVEGFRNVGTADSPGTVVCTVSGATSRAGVGEVPMGTPLRAVIDEVGDGLEPGREIGFVLQGAASSILTADQLDTPVSWEGFDAIGSGLGAAAFIVFDTMTDPVAVAGNVSRFLAVESCGQCTACKGDGLAIADALDRGRVGDADPRHLDILTSRLATVADGARCSLATQHQVVVGSLIDRFRDDFVDHHGAPLAAIERAAVLPMLDIADGRVVLDTDQALKQPDWTFDADYSGQWPADRLDDHRSHERL